MAYNRRVLWEHIRARLMSQPDCGLGDLSSQLQVERHTIERVIVEETGRKFRDFRNDVRLAIATDYLLNRPTLSIKQISALLHYENARAFSRFFRAKTGKSPSEYRSAESGSRELHPLTHRASQGG